MTYPAEEAVQNNRNKNASKPLAGTLRALTLKSSADGKELSLWAVWAAVRSAGTSSSETTCSRCVSAGQ